MRDGVNSLNRVEVIVPAAPGTGDTDSLTIIRGSFEKLTFSAGSVAAAAGTLTLRHSDDDSVYIDVPDAEVIGTQGKALVNGSIVSLGYTGDKKYIKARINLSADGVVYCVAEEGMARVNPNTTN